MGAPAVGYLVSLYPAISHTFVEREIQGLRGGGFSVDTVSLRRTPAAELLTEGDREAAAQTYVVLPPQPRRLIASHIAAIRRAPLRYVATLLAALRMSGGGVRNGLWQLFYFAEAALVLDVLHARGVRHVHAHFANAASMVALLTARLGGPGWSWSFSMHGPTEFDDVTRFALAEKVRAARFVACIGDYCRSQLMKLVEPAQWDKLSIVRCGADLARYTVVDRSERAAGPLRVLCVGRLVPDKGQRLLLDAVSSLRARGLDVRLTLVGDGVDRAMLEQRAEELGLADDVNFTGSVGQDQILALYAEADVFCLPSFAEGIPVVLMEAMATGLPVVTTEITGIPELVEDGASGILVPPGRADAIAAALERLADRATRERMGLHGRLRVEEEFDATAGAQAMQRLMSMSGPT